MGGEEERRKEINHAGKAKLTFVFGHQSLYGRKTPKMLHKKSFCDGCCWASNSIWLCYIEKGRWIYINLYYSSRYTSLVLLLLLLGSRLCLNVRHLNGKFLKGSSSKLNGSI